jgi:hypothetical protein
MPGGLYEPEGRICFLGDCWQIATYHQIVESGIDIIAHRAGKIKPHLVNELPLPAEDELSSGDKFL